MSQIGCDKSYGTCLIEWSVSMRCVSFVVAVVVVVGADDLIWTLDY